MALSPLYLPTAGTHTVHLGPSLKRKFASLDPSSSSVDNPNSRRHQRQRRHEPTSEFHAVQFGRQPESVDPARGSSFELAERLADGSARVQAERQSATPSKPRDCLLLYDPATQTFTLELLTSATALTYDRSATNRLKRQAGLEVSATPSGSGSGQSVLPLGEGDEPTPLDLGEAGYGDAEIDAEMDADAEGEVDADADESPVNRDTNTSDETYVNADVDPELEEPPRPHQRQQPGQAYEEIHLGLGGGYVSEESDLLAEGEELDADGVTDADAEGVTDADADADLEVAHEQDADADEEDDDFLLADLTTAAQEEDSLPELELEPEPEPEPRARRRRSSTANAVAHVNAPPPPPPLRLALPTARRMSLRSATTQAINDVTTVTHSASTLPPLGTTVNGAGGEKKWDDDSDSDSEDDEDDEDEGEGEGSFAAAGALDVDPAAGDAGEPGDGEGEDSDFDFLAADMQAEDDDDEEEEGEDGEGEGAPGEESPLAKQSLSRGRTARQLDIWDEEDE
ncbi:hypothetical protein CALVIDRAFT_320648 [Calocera viscosa TUFC12733]|uniref:Transcription elongation factor Eaf N-terminal domain-containing protein n=1 Tax=Calocera viscosa (strain TUFC12733) TaxID=1330018 RepID=A0A167QLX2_CALVF|nr:hypothetical protein CALVIDRAFT_320648 [Calocera viscosa TUFC12733]